MEQKENNNENRNKISDGRILVGSKPTSNYVVAAMMQIMKMGNGASITLSSRGKNISTAVDVAEILTQKHLKGRYVVGAITSGSEDFKSDILKKTIRVSHLDIVIDPMEVSKTVK